MRFEDDVLAGLIDINSRVLDVGCGDGNLLLHLKKNKKVDGRGIEIDQKKVQESVAKGLAVIEGDAEKDLISYPNSSFDFAILNQSLQQFYDPRKVMNELLRIAKKAIITIPNFGYWKVRLQLVLRGTMPVTKNLPYTWYNTPNLHMCTIKDFYNLCRLDNITIEKSISVSSDKISNIQRGNLEIKNLLSEIGIFLIKK
ncbi:MAG: methionine biosynthesis protein MetW [Proteobacteria bacterium]|jgi:methionine biosynthesis protein MetW|nr:methionine biosynthesis protein MetW [Pseudomonadota bacterium]MDA0971092.1 methionine biosynthesis protein MetW [Pseudomonadota bacterium]MDA0995737.1 methionine biosynthesis protein MetW [Pseudomonadota bacterium]